MKKTKGIMSLRICGVFALTNLLLVSGNCEVKTGEGMKKGEISLGTALEKSNEKAKELGYDLSRMRVIADEENSIWKAYVKSGPVLEWNPDLRKQLEGRDFWAIGYMPKEPQLGGDLTVFIDKQTGNIITVIQGQ